MPELIDKRHFVFGVNLPWLDGEIAHDFGKNVVMGHNLPAYDDPQKKANLESYFKDIRQMGAHVVRLWVFEMFEGLIFDNEGMVTGIDELLVKNMAEVMKLARKHGLFLYLCLLDTWGITAHSPEHVSRLNKIISDTQVRRSFIENAVKKFLSDQSLKTNRIFAVDVMNEPEGMYSSIWREEIEWKDVLRFIGECAWQIKKLGIRVSCGFQRYETLLESKEQLRNLDFYDYHEYNDEGKLIHYGDLDLDKPCIIGECGQKSEEYDDSIHEKAIKNFITNSWQNDYSGCLIWYYSHKGYNVSDSNNHHSLITSSGKWRKSCKAIFDFERKHRKYMIF